MKIDKNITIEDLVEKYPESIDFLSKNRIRCIRCGEPIMGTLEEAAKEKAYSDDEIEKLTEELNKLVFKY